jgi:hypothetical protein
MAVTAISIRNLDPDVKARLRVRAAEHGCFFDALRAIALEHGGVDLDLRRDDYRQRPIDLT